MKYPQYILAIDADFVNDFITNMTAYSDTLTYSGSLQQEKYVLDVTPYHTEAVSQSMQNYGMAIKRRNELETNLNYKQILPYCVVQADIPRTPEAPYSLVVAYRRATKNGEARLAGKVSIGIGGHVDLADCVQSEDSVLDVDSTIDFCIRREVVEEIIVTASGYTDMRFPLKRDHSLIVDNSESVGQVHLGVVSTFTIPGDSIITTKDDEIEMIGFVTTKDLLENYPTLENWSKMLCVRDVEQAEEFLKSLPE